MQCRQILSETDIDTVGFHELFSHSRTRAYMSLGWIDINAPIEKDTEGSLLHIVAKRENGDLVDFLLKQGADPNVKDLKQRKPADVSSVHLGV